MPSILLPFAIDAVSDSMSKWATEMAREHQANDKPTEQQMKRASAVGERMGSCMTKIMSTSITPVD